MIKVAVDQKAMLRKKDKRKKHAEELWGCPQLLCEQPKKNLLVLIEQKKNKRTLDRKITITDILLYLYSDDMSLTYVANNHVRSSVYVYRWSTISAVPGFVRLLNNGIPRDSSVFPNFFSIFFKEKFN